MNHLTIAQAKHGLSHPTDETVAQKKTPQKCIQQNALSHPTDETVAMEELK